MPKDPGRDAFLNQAGADTPARNWFTLANGDIGAAELSIYGKALEVFVQSSYASFPLNIVVVPIDAADADTRTIPIPAVGHYVLPRAVRRIVSVAGGATIPSGVQIDIITK